MPEIADGLVEITNVAREPGYRSKIAVVSHADGVDPVGACVGPRGSRVRMVVSELRGEKIDIIPYNDEPARFVAKALSPARVREVLVDDEAKQATVIVPDDQLSLAIGREGQNARLAARLTGWRIDIRSETEFAQEEAEHGYEEEETCRAAAPRSSPTAAAARTPRCRARATAASTRTRRSTTSRATRSPRSPTAARTTLGGRRAAEAAARGRADAGRRSARGSRPPTDAEVEVAASRRASEIAVAEERGRDEVRGRGVIGARAATALRRLRPRGAEAVAAALGRRRRRASSPTRRPVCRAAAPTPAARAAASSGPRAAAASTARSGAR